MHYTIHVDNVLPQKSSVNVRCASRYKPMDFRLFVKARDGRWYKQPNPVSTGVHWSHWVDVTLGDGPDDVGYKYQLLVVDAERLPIHNTYLNAIPQEMHLSDIVEVTCV